jgi:hypothetical protein
MTDRNAEGQNPEGQNAEGAPRNRGEDDPRVVVIGPDGMAMAGAAPGSANSEEGDQPAKVMRIGSMIRQLLEEVKAAPLDEASRTRLAGIHKSSIKELEAGLAPELIEELERLSLPFSSDTPSDAELRIAQAQLVGWLEGLFHGIQTAIYAQQVAARAQLEQMRRALPPGVMSEEAMRAAQQAAQAQAARQGPGDQRGEEPGRGGMYL